MDSFYRDFVIQRYEIEKGDSGKRVGRGSLTITAGLMLFICAIR